MLAQSNQHLGNALKFLLFAFLKLGELTFEIEHYILYVQIDWHSLFVMDLMC
jgi:hypothetical protein